MKKPSTRKGATRSSHISPAVPRALERDELPTATLVEGLAIRQSRLLCSAFPELDSEAFAEAAAADALGIVRRMARMSEIVLARVGPKSINLAYP